MPEFKYPAAVSVLTAAVRLIDRTHDDHSPGSKIPYAIWRKRIRETERDLRDLGLSMPSIENLVQEQHRRESEAGKELVYYSGMTEEMYSRIFSQTAILAKAPKNASYLAEVGKHLGRIAYLLDGYADFQKDMKEGSFNVLNQLPSNRVGQARLDEARKVVVAQVSHSLQCIQQNILKVKLHRFQTPLQYTITTGLRNKTHRILASVINPLSKPALYSMAPLIGTLVLVGLRTLITPLQSGDSSDCCDCNSFIPTPEACIGAAINHEVSNIASHAQQGVEAAAVGGAAAVTISAIASHLSASSQQPSTDTTSQDTPPSSTDAQEPSAPPEEPHLPPEQTPQLPPETTQPPETPPETTHPPTELNFGDSTLHPDEVKQTIQWGVQHNRSLEDIQHDLNALDKARGGSGNVDLSNLPQDQQPVQVSTPTGQTTMTQQDAAEYNAQQLILGDVNQRANQIYDQLQKLQGDSAFWRKQELDVGKRTLAGGYRLHEANQAYEDTVNQINQKYQQPDLKNYRDSLDWHKALEDWRKTPEGQGTGISEQHAAELRQAQSAHVNRLEELTGRKDVSSQPAPQPGWTERAVQYGDNQPTYASRPTSGESWWHKPSVKLDSIEQQQQSLIDELKRLEQVKRTALDKMKSIQEHGAQDGADGG